MSYLPYSYDKVLRNHAYGQPVVAVEGQPFQAPAAVAISQSGPPPAVGPTVGSHQAPLGQVEYLPHLHDARKLAIPPPMGAPDNTLRSHVSGGQHVVQQVVLAQPIQSSDPTQVQVRKVSRGLGGWSFPSLRGRMAFPSFRVSGGRREEGDFFFPTLMYVKKLKAPLFFDSVDFFSALSSSRCGFVLSVTFVVKTFSPSCAPSHPLSCFASISLLGSSSSRLLFSVSCLHSKVTLVGDNTPIQAPCVSPVVSLLKNQTSNATTVDTGCWAFFRVSVPSPSAGSSQRFNYFVEGAHANVFQVYVRDSVGDLAPSSSYMRASTSTASRGTYQPDGRYVGSVELRFSFTMWIGIFGASSNSSSYTLRARGDYL